MAIRKGQMYLKFIIFEMKKKKGGGVNKWVKYSLETPEEKGLSSPQEWNEKNTYRQRLKDLGDKIKWYNININGVTGVDKVTMRQKEDLKKWYLQTVQNLVKT